MSYFIYTDLISKLLDQDWLVLDQLWSTLVHTAQCVLKLDDIIVFEKGELEFNLRSSQIRRKIGISSPPLQFFMQNRVMRAVWHYPEWV